MCRGSAAPKRVTAGALAALLEERARRSGPLLLGLDFDGTLAALAATPGRARLGGRARRMLAALARRPGWRVAILSGRGLRDVRAKVRVRGACYAGNHGLELLCRGTSWVHPAVLPLRSGLRRVLRAVRREARHFPGALIQPKGLTASVHFRRLRHGSGRALARALRRLLPAGFRLSPGKKVWEVRPALAWDKGEALLLLARELGARSLAFIGDDRTDEEAFASLGSRAVTVRVGLTGPTRARCRLAGVRDVDRLLARLSRLRKKPATALDRRA